MAWTFFSLYVPLFLWIGVIFMASSEAASLDETSQLITPMLKFLFPSASDETLHTCHVFIRKLAHFVEYATLSFLASRAFWSSSLKLFRNYWHILAMIMTLLVAAIDEINQSFNYTRDGLFSDVLLDGLSGLIMIVILFIYKNNYGKSENRSIYGA